jgi:retron-type reverse transcriptase
MKMLKDYCDQPTCELIGKLIRTGYIDIHNLNDRAAYNNKIGMPQGSILSPLLSNFYLNKLDQFMEEKLLRK